MEVPQPCISVSSGMLVLQLMRDQCLEHTWFLLSLEADEFYVELDRLQQFRLIRNLHKVKSTSLIRKVELEGEFRAPKEIDSIF